VVLAWVGVCAVDAVVCAEDRPCLRSKLILWTLCAAGGGIDEPSLFTVSSAFDCSTINHHTNIIRNTALEYSMESWKRVNFGALAFTTYKNLHNLVTLLCTFSFGLGRWEMGIT
jgi:hypothetical protein